MTTSLMKSLPAGYIPRSGVRGLRLRDVQPVSVRSMTELARTTYTPTDMHTGNVYASQLKLAVYGNGYWWWTGNLDDTSEVFGDNFAIGFSFEDSGVAVVKTGELGASATSTPQHIHFALQGRSDTLQPNYLQCVAGGLKFKLYVSDDVAGLFADIGDDLKWLGRQLTFSASYNSGSTGWDPPSDPGDDGTLEGGEDA
jgi:hypothetical protein